MSDTCVGCCLSSAKFVPVDIVGGETEAVTARVGGGANPDGCVDLPFFPEPALAPYVGRRCRLGIGPEALTELRAGETDRQEMGHFACRADVVEPTGADGLTDIRMHGADVIARVRPGQAAAPGQVTRSALDMVEVNLFDPEPRMRLDLQKRRAASQNRQGAA